MDSSYTPSPRRNFAAAQLLNRPALATRPVSIRETLPFDLVIYKKKCFYTISGTTRT